MKKFNEYKKRLAELEDKKADAVPSLVRCVQAEDPDWKPKSKFSAEKMSREAVIRLSEILRGGK